MVSALFAAVAIVTNGVSASFVLANQFPTLNEQKAAMELSGEWDFYLLLNDDSFVKDIQILSIQYILQILSVLVLFQNFIYIQHIFPTDPTVQIGDLFQTGDFSMLVLFYRLDEIGGIH